MATEDEQAILAQLEKFREAWNQGDARAAASLFSEDGMRVGPSGDENHGRAEIEAAFIRMAELTGGAQVAYATPEIRLLAPEIALANTYVEMTNDKGLEIKGHTLEVLQKVGGQWMIVEAHPKIFPPAIG